MIMFKKYIEGLAVIDDDRGLSMLLTVEEEATVKNIFPEIEDPSLSSLYIDFLPGSLSFIQFRE